MKSPDELTRIFSGIGNGLALLEAVFSRSPVATRINRPDGQPVLINGAYHQLFSAVEMPADFDAAQREASEGRLSRIPTTWRTRGSGKAVTEPTADSVALAATFFPIFSAEGDVAFVAAVVVDETNERRALLTLRESETKFRQLSENIGEVFWLRNIDSSKIFYVSPAYRKIWGRNEEDLYQDPRNWLKSIHPEDIDLVLKQVAEHPTAEYEAEYRIVRPDGTIRWIRDRGFPVLDESGKIYRVAGIALDITEQKSLWQQLNQSQKLEAVGQLAAGVAHDFNNLLTAIVGYAQMLSLALPADDERQGDIQEVHQTADRATHLTRQLLAFSRQQVMRPQSVGVNALIAEIYRMLERMIGEDIRIEQDLAEEVGLVRVDPGQLEQVIMNLAVNARDAMPKGGTLLIATRAIDIGEGGLPGQTDLVPGTYIRISVTDTGVGIPPENLAKIFEPFFTTKEKGKGTGLGLSTVYGIIKQSGGAITAASTPGQGCRFDIYLPRLGETVASYQGRKQTRPILVSGKGTVLVVEDEIGVRRLTSRILTGCGYAVVEASTPLEALSKVERPDASFDLLLTDVVLPGMNGKELADRARQAKPELRVLFISGYANDVIVKSGVLDAGLPFLEKPFNAVSLSHKVAETLGSLPPENP